MDATPSTQSCYRRCNSARFTHHTVLPVRAWAALTVHPDFASYNIRKALACRQFRRFTGGVDVFRTCAIPSAGARVSARATRCVRFVANVHQRVLLRPCKFRQASLIGKRLAASMLVGARVGRDWSLRKCDTIVERPARCRSSSELDLPRAVGAGGSGPFLNRLRSRGQ